MRIFVAAQHRQFTSLSPHTHKSNDSGRDTTPRIGLLAYLLFFWPPSHKHTHTHTHTPSPCRVSRRHHPLPPIRPSRGGLGVHTYSSHRRPRTACAQATNVRTHTHSSIASLTNASPSAPSPIPLRTCREHHRHPLRSPPTVVTIERKHNPFGVYVSVCDGSFLLPHRHTHTLWSIFLQKKPSYFFLSLAFYTTNSSHQRIPKREHTIVRLIKPGDPPPRYASIPPSPHPHPPSSQHHSRPSPLNLVHRQAAFPPSHGS